MENIIKIIKTNNVNKIKFRLILPNLNENYFNLILWNNNKLINIFIVNLKEITEILTEFNIKFDLDKIINSKEIIINEIKL